MYADEFVYLLYSIYPILYIELCDNILHFTMILIIMQVLLYRVKDRMSHLGVRIKLNSQVIFLYIKCIIYASKVCIVEFKQFLYRKHMLITIL